MCEFSAFVFLNTSTVAVISVFKFAGVVTGTEGQAIQGWYSVAAEGGVSLVESDGSVSLPGTARHKHSAQVNRTLAASASAFIVLKNNEFEN